MAITEQDRTQIVGAAKALFQERKSFSLDVNVIPGWRQNLIIIWRHTNIAFSFPKLRREPCRLV